MTLITLPSPLAWPGIVPTVVGTPTAANVATLSAAGHFVSYVFCAREDMVISHLAFRASTSTGSPTCTVGIETVDTSGIPSGSAGFGSTNGTTATISSNTFVTTALGGSATISKGTIFAAKVAYATGTSQIIGHLGSVKTPHDSGLPYQVVNTGSNAKAILASIALFGLGSSSTTFYQVPGTMPVVYTAGTFNNTNSAKRGLRFTPPMNCRAVGIRWYNGNAAGDYNAVLFDDAGSELSSSSTAFDGDQNASSTFGSLSVFFDNAVTLTAGTTYRIAIEPSSATNVNVSTLDLPSSSYRGTTPAGTTAHYTTFATATWTDTATDKIPVMDVLIDQVDDGSGSGSGGGSRSRIQSGF